jgi:hypothetical protein
VLASEVVDRTYSNWLEPAGVDRPAIDFLASTMTDVSPGAGGTFTVEGVQQFIPPSTIVEIDSELILTKDVTTTVLTVAERGFRDTIPAAHAIGAQVRIDPKYSRKTLLDHLGSVIGLLQPWGVYRYGTDTTLGFTSRSILTLPSGAEEIISVAVRSFGDPEQWRTFTQDGEDWILFDEFTPPKYQLLAYASEGAEMVVSWRGDFVAPTLEADNLDTLGIPTKLQPYLPLAVAGTALQSREIPRVQIEDIRRQLATNGIQVGTALNVGEAMLRSFRAVYVAAERQRQRRRDPVRLVWARTE